MLRMCVYMHSRFVENHPIWILEDGYLISEVVLSQAYECSWFTDPNREPADHKSLNFLCCQYRADILI
jgi:hypothetical protein